MQGRSLTAFLLGIVLAGQSPAQVRADFLSNLIAGNGSIKVGNLVFDQFSYAPTGQMPTAANVNVNPTFDAKGEPGIRISAGFTDMYDGAGATQQASDAVLSYRVSAVGGQLNGINLLGNPQVIGGGDGILSVTETFLAGTQPVQLVIYDSVNNGVHSQKLQASSAFAPVQSLQIVTKDILGFNLGGFPTASFIDQTFSTAIPEPGSLVLVALGIAGLAGYRRRQQRIAAAQG